MQIRESLVRGSGEERRSWERPTDSSQEQRGWVG